MRRVVIRRVDNNQALIVRAFRAAGCTVEHLHQIGKGCPDLLIGAAILVIAGGSAGAYMMRGPAGFGPAGSAGAVSGWRGSGTATARTTGQVRCSGVRIARTAATATSAVPTVAAASSSHRRRCSGAASGASASRVWKCCSARCRRSTRTGA